MSIQLQAQRESRHVNEYSIAIPEQNQDLQMSTQLEAQMALRLANAKTLMPLHSMVPASVRRAYRRPFSRKSQCLLVIHVKQRKFAARRSF